MNYYKDINNRLHALSDADISNGGERYLPQGCVQITLAEADAIQNPPKTLTEVKAVKLEELKAAWNNTQNLGISTRGKTFAAGGQARAQLDRLLAAQANGITIPTTIRADDGTPIDFTAVTIKGLYDMIIKTERIAEDNYWSKRALVEAATTVAAVEAVSW